MSSLVPRWLWFKRDRRSSSRRLIAVGITVFAACVLWASSYVTHISAWLPRTAYPVSFDETFARGWLKHWALTLHPRTAGVSFDPSKGIRWSAQTMGPWGNQQDRAIAAWPIGSRAFELNAELQLDQVRWQQYFQAGVAVVLTSRPPSRMTDQDVCLVCHVHFAGVAVSAWRGWFLDHAAKQISATTGGGDQLESARWHFRHVRDAKLRFQVRRDPDRVTWRVWSNTVPELSPWAEEKWQIPKTLRDTMFRYVIVQRVPVRPRHFGYPGFEVSGCVTRISGRPLDKYAAGITKDNFDRHSFASRSQAGDVQWVQPQPRMLWDQDRLAELRSRWGDPAFRDYRAQIEAASARNDPLAMLLANQLGDDAGAGDRLRGWLRDTARKRQAIDFDGSDWINVALAYDTLPISRGDRRLLQGYLRFMLHTAPLCHDDWFWNPKHNPSNTTAVANSAAGIVAMALLDEVPLARRVATAARRTLRRFAGRCTTDDGGYIEGTLYWNYALGHYLLFLDVWRRCGIDAAENRLDGGLVNNDRYAEAVVGGDGRMVTFNDTQPWTTGAAVLTFLDRELDRPRLRALAAQMMRQGSQRYASLAFLFHRDDLPPKKSPRMPLISELPDLQLATLRSDDAFVPGGAVSLTGVPPQVSHHAQADAGSINYSVGGQPVLIDPGYFQPDADAHSIPEIQVGDQVFQPQPGVATQWIGAGQIADMRWAGVDSSRAYLPTKTNTAKNTTMEVPLGLSVRRTVVLHQSDLAVIDWVTIPSSMRGEVQVIWRWQWALRPNYARNGYFLRTRNINVAMRSSILHSRKAISRNFGDSWIFRRLAQAGEFDWHTTTATVSDRDLAVVTLLESGSGGGSWKIDPEHRWVELKFADSDPIRFHSDGPVSRPSGG